MLIGLRDVGVLTLGRQSGWGAFCGHHAAADLRSRRLWVAGVPTQSPGATVPVFAVSAQVYRLTQYPAGRAVLLALVVSGLLVVRLRFDLVEGGAAALNFGDDVLGGG
ncbi:MAG: hypothetical protein WCE76_09410, partial [Mycobacterium sp.]